MRPGPYREISAGGSTWCGLRDNDTIECWGDQLGKSPSPLRGKFRSVSVGDGLVCGIQLNWDMACAQLEDSEGDHRPTHVAGPFSSMSADGDVCAVNATR